jgi:hypothetical protein
MLIGFFLWKGKRDPVYILALPLLLVFGRSIFLDLYALQVPLRGGVSVNQEDVFLLALIILFFYVRAIRPSADLERPDLQLYLCAVILVILTVKAFMSGLSGWTDVIPPRFLYTAAKSGLVERAWFYLPLSIVLWRLILKRFSRQEILRLLEIITWVTVACSVVYIADRMGLRSYTRIWHVYLTEKTPNGTTISRDYLTLPIWLNIALGYSLTCLVYGRQRATYFLVAVITTGCAFISFTRNFALSSAGLWVIAFFWWAVVVRVNGRGRQPRAPIRHQTPIGRARVILLTSAYAAIFAALVLRWSLLVTWWGYLGERLSSLAQGSGGDENLAVRFHLYSLAVRTIDHDGFFLGTLMTASRSNSGVYFADSYWAEVLVSVGWLGLIVVGAVVVVAVGKAVVEALKTHTESAEVSLAILLALLMMVAASFTNAGFLFTVVAGAFLLAAPGVRFRVPPNSSVGARSGIEGS